MRAAAGAIEGVRIDPQTKRARFRVIGEDKWSDIWPLPLADTSAMEQPHYRPAGICGSGIIEAVAEMYLAGIILSNGRFNPDCTSEWVQWDGRRGQYILATGEETGTGEPIVITQQDVRNVQLAKAAMYASAKLLMKRAGIESVDHILLAGAFGSYTDPKYAMILGMIPDCDLNNVFAVGNAAGDGARIALLNRYRRKEAQDIARQVQYVETATDPDFQTEFVGAMPLPHQSDSFPHLKDELPVPVASANPSPRRRWRRRNNANVA